MKPVISPLKFGDHSADVANLQSALLLLIDKGIIQLAAAEAQTFKSLISQEQQSQVYKDGTSKAVALFQQQHQLQATATVDAPTAAALNQILKGLGVLDSAQNGQKPMVAGQVMQDDRTPFKGIVILFFEADQGSIRQGEDATDPEGRYTIGYNLTLDPNGTKLRVAAFDPDNKLRANATIQATKSVEIVNLTVPHDAPLYYVDGRVASRSRGGVAGLRVQIVDKNVGADVQLIEVATANDGSYHAAFPYSGSKQKADLQARVLTGEQVLGTSDVRYNAANAETLNVVLPDGTDAALASEHETLTSTLAIHYAGSLGALKESAAQQDITYLANKSGLDGRLVTMLALADQFATAANATIHPAFFYALFRAGVPANEDALYRLDSGTVTNIWQKAAQQGLLPQNQVDMIPKVTAQFQNLSAQRLLTSSALPGASAMKDMLSISGLNADQQQKFAQLYTANQSDPPTFWKSVGTSLGQGIADRLQLDGKLGFMTFNSAPLMQVLHKATGANGLSDPLQLAQVGYYKADAWLKVLTADIPIPAQIPGATPEEQKATYASSLATLIRVSYPTAVLAGMIKSGEIPLTGAAPGISDSVHAFLTEHQGKFEIGVQPIQQYIHSNNLVVPNEVVTQIQRVQRVYQMTTDDQALAGLLKHDIHAAYHVASLDRDTFVATVQQDVGGTDVAAQIYEKALQIHTTCLNLAVSYMTARNGLVPGALPMQIGQQNGIGSGQAFRALAAPADAGDVIAYPTLESLFGSMDFCSCADCRSVLSPAAYLVDLLMFIDQPPPSGSGKENPLTVLLARRPDIQHLPLTCENTNTALPYIDVVNETLEYFVANDVQKLSLTGYMGHDTDEMTSADLLASPQFVIDGAYTILQNEHFPAPLPFSQPLEELRRYFATCGVVLPLAMKRLRKNDDLERGTNLYGWRDILMETVNLSRDEYAILTNSTTDPLWRLYGFPTGTSDADVIAALSNVKQFTVRVGITYDDIVALVQTRFINPNGALLPLLKRLDVPFITLNALKDGTLLERPIF